jgi:hypothetical protein
MITTGSKLFYGLGSATTVAAILWFIANDGGSIGVVSLAFLAVALFFMGAITSFVRDGHVLSTETDAHATSNAAQRGVGRSWFPFGTAISAGMVAVGMVSSPGIFTVGICLLFAMLGQWLIKNWSDRASSDAAYNEKVRAWVVHPLEIPVGGAILLAVIVLSFSRIMLALSKEGGLVVFSIMAALVLAFGSMVSVRRGASRRVVGTVAGVVLVALSGTGIAMALDGERHELTVAAEEDHFAHRACGEEAEETDEDAARSVSAKSSVAATVVLRDGRLFAEMDGWNGELSSITLQRSNPSTILFVNEDDHEHRMVVTYGKITEDLGGGVSKDTVLEACTSLITKGGTQAVSVVIPKPSFASDEPYSITVPGVEGASIEIQVP